MDGFDATQAPAAYKTVEPIVNILTLAMTLGWLVNYAGMIHISFKEKTYAMGIMPLLIYPPKNRLELIVTATALIVNVAIMYSAMRHSPNEWSHAPLVQRNLRYIFAVAAFCRLLLGTGGLCQLLCRGSSRGASNLLWISRFIGSLSLVSMAALRWRYWPEAFAWLDNPLILWSVGMFLFLDLSYGLCYWYILRVENLNNNRDS
ncbi:hypothetical protein BO83DRAFT_395783 [Aspergillus eucalypticola CBS 122712]|uniref:Integral membrane protein n=1 Tax=Aspergillus eucalypticola (strain CBS 122712 / IBT 29274) TaxID=1448314 RepID=A0A317W7V3_ASPEC|nr:uncharacterized protein BO83DRAFT_395783 [Aspergillus eucalypticola CBS 122712]PWY82726.1 hypothetical protein BO83DRAFT_395783 [Aspergillus eucalypticola CBS 122712]